MGDQVTAEIKGLDDLNEKIAEAVKRVKRDTADRLFLGAEIIMTDAKNRTPVLTGALRESGHVEEPKVTDSEISVRLAFGGPAAPYAVYVHERQGLHHPVGEAKFLENAVNAGAPHLLAALAAE